MDEIEKIKKENEKLKMINENKSEIISVSAHQLRTSLSALKWTLKMFLDGELGKTNKKQKDYIEKSIRSNERAITLVNYLLIFNNSEDPRMMINLRQVDISKTFDKIIDEFFGELKNKNIDLIFKKPKIKIPDIFCDEEMIIVVIQNLIENAIKYSICNSKIDILIKNNTKKNELIISIHDQGIGIKKQDQLKIFNKFFRAPNAIKKEDIGSGLGLFITKNIIEKHDGKIWFESSQKSGTTFFVKLPFSKSL
jgi:signal transduction histidine kinase